MFDLESVPRRSASISSASKYCVLSLEPVRSQRQRRFTSRSGSILGAFDHERQLCGRHLPLQLNAIRSRDSWLIQPKLMSASPCSQCRRLDLRVDDRPQSKGDIVSPQRGVEMLSNKRNFTVVLRLLVLCMAKSSTSKLQSRTGSRVGEGQYAPFARCSPTRSPTEQRMKSKQRDRALPGTRGIHCRTARLAEPYLC
jgi:hypothetical protein